MSNESILESIEDLASEYVKAQKEADKAKAIADKLKEKLREQMVQSSLSNVATSEGADVICLKRTTVKFDAALIAYLKRNGYDTYVIETLDETALKKAMKNSEMMYQDVKPYVKENVSYALTIKEI